MCYQPHVTIDYCVHDIILRKCWIDVYSFEPNFSCKQVEIGQIEVSTRELDEKEKQGNFEKDIKMKEETFARFVSHLFDKVFEWWKYFIQSLSI